VTTTQLCRKTHPFDFRSNRSWKWNNRSGLTRTLGGSDNVGSEVVLMSMLWMFEAMDVDVDGGSDLRLSPL